MTHKASELTIKLSRIQSAKIIEDPDKVLAVIGDKHHILQGKNDALVLSKYIGFKDNGDSSFNENQIQSLVEQRGIPWDEDYINKVIPYWASDERVDGEGDIVRQNWEFDEFERNSPLVFSHRWSEAPIGRMIDWRVKHREDGDYSGPALWLLSMFALSKDSAKADSIFRLVKAGILVGGSVGFWSSRVILIEDDEERAELGLGRWGVIFDHNHLLEFSPTTIPANPGAVALLTRHRKLIQPQDVHVLRELKRQEIVKDTENDIEKWLQTEQLLLQVAKSFWPEEKFEFHPEFDVPIIEEKESTTQTWTAEFSVAVDDKTIKIRTDKQEDDEPEPEDDEEEPASDSQKLDSIISMIETLVSGFQDFSEQCIEVLSDIQDKLGESTEISQNREGQRTSDSEDETYKELLTVAIKNIGTITKEREN